MAKQRKKVNVNPQEYRAKKISLVKNNPDTSIVYVFGNPLIRDRFSKISREAVAIKNAAIDLWGWVLFDEDKAKIDEGFERVKGLAQKITDASKEFGEFDYTQLVTTGVNQKIRLIQKFDSPLVEVFIPQNEDEDVIFEALFRIDKFDDVAKRNPQKSKEWIELLREYEEALKNFKEEAFKLFQEKIRAKHLIKYSALRNEFRRWLKENNLKETADNQ